MNEIDLERHINALTQKVRRTCFEKQSVCLAFALILVDPLSPDGINMPVAFLGDRHDPVDEAERKRMVAAFQFLEKGIKMILAGEQDDIIMQ